MKNFFIINILISICLSSCFREYENSKIWKEKDILLGILAPDSSTNYVRSYNTEVYVGRMIPGSGSSYIGMESYDLLYLVFEMVNENFVVLQYDSTATVMIESNDQSVTLSHTHYGIYADTEHRLKIKAGELYRLIVEKQNGKRYTAQTTVPKPFQLLLPSGDTIHTTPDFQGNANYPLQIAAMDTPSYVARIDSSNFGMREMYSFADELNGFVTFPYSHNPVTLNVRSEIRIINHDLGNFRIPSYSYFPISGSKRFNDFRNDLKEETLKERSNIHGDNVIGVFGAYNVIRKRYYVHELRNTLSRSSKEKIINPFIQF